MPSALTLRTISRFLGVLALVVALVRFCLAVVRHSPIPWLAVAGAVAICAIVWLLPLRTGEAGGELTG